MIAPAFLIQFNGNIDIAFDDFEDLKESGLVPIPLHHTFNDVIEFAKFKTIHNMDQEENFYDEYKTAYQNFDEA